MFLILRRYAVYVLLVTVLTGMGSLFAQRPITSSSSAAQQYGTMPGLAGQNQSQMQYGSIGGVVDNNATAQQTDTTQKNRKSVNRSNPTSSTIRHGREIASLGTLILNGTISI